MALRSVWTPIGGHGSCCPPRCHEPGRPIPVAACGSRRRPGPPKKRSPGCGTGSAPTTWHEPDAAALDQPVYDVEQSGRLLNLIDHHAFERALAQCSDHIRFKGAGVPPQAIVYGGIEQVLMQRAQARRRGTKQSGLPGAARTEEKETLVGR